MAWCGGLLGGRTKKRTGEHYGEETGKQRWLSYPTAFRCCSLVFPPPLSPCYYPCCNVGRGSRFDPKCFLLPCLDWTIARAVISHSLSPQSKWYRVLHCDRLGSMVVAPVVDGPLASLVFCGAEGRSLNH